MESLTLRPIGYVTSELKTKFDTPHQPGQHPAKIELLPHFEFETALSDLFGFDYIWVLFWFHKNPSWRPKVRPPRGDSTKRGVFATRSPHRPNPIGLSAVPLLGISGRTISIGASDFLDGTPVFDIKPYIPECDSFPSARIGWLSEVAEFYAQPPRYQIVISPRAETELQWLHARGVNFFDNARALLERDPRENKTRRIKRHGDNLFRMGCAEWRIFFSLCGETICIEQIAPGYSQEKLESPGAEIIRNSQIQLEFLRQFPEERHATEQAVRE